MFSSEQKFEVSGDISQLEATIKFAIEMYELGKSSICFQITEDGRFCLGWGDTEGWEKFPFDYDPHIIAEIVKQHLAKQEYDNSAYSYYDGCIENGFLMKAIPSLFSDVYENIKKPFYGIVSIEPFVNFYAK